MIMTTYKFTKKKINQLLYVVSVSKVKGKELEMLILHTVRTDMPLQKLAG